MRRMESGKCDILREAETVADAYLRSALLTPRRRRSGPSGALFAALGAVGTGLVWLALHLAHIL